MATVSEAPITGGYEEMPYAITSDIFFRMVGEGLIPEDRRVFLWSGRLYEKMAKSKAHSAVQNAFNQALTRRLPSGLFVGNENPLRLDETHVPLPDLVVVRGNPLDFFDTRYPEGEDVVLVVEVAVSSRIADLGARLRRYASTLPQAAYIVADIAHRQILLHTTPRVVNGTGGAYEHRSVINPGEMLPLRLDNVDLEPIPYEEVMR